jgi:hypothetical protein
LGCRLALQALAAGADINAAYRTPRAHKLVRDTIALDKDPSSPTKQAAAANMGADGSSGNSTNTSRMIGQAGGGSSSSSSSQQHPSGASTAAAVGGNQQQQEEQQPDTPSSWAACGSVSVLHAAAASGDRVLLELLLQNGASWQQLDAGGRSALHYALLHEAVDCAKQLLRRGGGQLAGMRDGRGRSAMDLCLAKGKVEDEELFLLLSG